MKIVKISGVAGSGKTVALRLLQQHFGGKMLVGGNLTAAALKKLLLTSVPLGESLSISLGESRSIFLDEVTPKNMAALKALQAEFRDVNYDMIERTPAQTELMKLRRIVVYCAGEAI